MTTNQSPTYPRSPHQHDFGLVHRIETALASPTIEGSSVGSTLTDVVLIDLINDGVRYGIAQQWADKLRWLKYRFRADQKAEDVARGIEGGILVTWRSAETRWVDLILPVVRNLQVDRCCVLYVDPKVPSLLPTDMASVELRSALSYDSRAWWKAFKQCWPLWKANLQRVCREEGLPRGAVDHLAVQVLVNTQNLIGCRDLLQCHRPAAILTEFDRGALWSPLVLAGRSLGIPTFSLLHGVLPSLPKGYQSTLSDVLFCWGEFDRKQIADAGIYSKRLVLGGCPRMTRDSSITVSQARSRLGLDLARKVVLLGTAPYSRALREHIVEVFCGGVEQMSDVQGVVRLHPSEKLDDYAVAAHRHPAIRFSENDSASLDEVMSASDVVVVHNSGLGSDALVKRRPVAVIDVPGCIIGHGEVLVERAGCPKTATAEEFVAVIRRILSDADYRRQLHDAAEEYVAQFCAYFGEESAKRIAGVVQSAIAPCRDSLSCRNGDAIPSL